jgi:hypothetical protein
VSWETAEDLVSKTSNGRRKMAKLAEGTEEELAIDDVADYTIVERILDCQVVTTEVDSATIGAGSGAGTVETKWFRIKWQGALSCVYLCWWWRSLYVWVGMTTHPHFDGCCVLKVYPILKAHGRRTPTSTMTPFS